MLETMDTPEFDGIKPYSPEYAILFKAWCKKHNAYYYARPKEDFSLHEGRYLAQQAHADILIYENMS